MLKWCLGFIFNKFIHFHMHSKAKCVRTREDSEREKIQKGDPGSEVFLIPGCKWFSQRFDFRASSMIYRIVTQLRHDLDGSAQGKKNHLPMKNFISFNSLFYSRIERHHRRQVCFSRRLFLNRPRKVAQIQNCYFCDKDSLYTTNRSSFWAKSVARVKISVKINRCLCAARNSGSNFSAPHSQSSVQR